MLGVIFVCKLLAQTVFRIMKKTIYPSDAAEKAKDCDWRRPPVGLFFEPAKRARHF